MPAQLIADVARQIAEERGITHKQAFRYARAAQEVEPVPEGMSKKDAVLEALFRLNSNAGVGAPHLATTMKNMGVPISLHELTSLCWDLQKQQCVAFKESHTSGGSVLSRIRLTQKGRAIILMKHQEANEADTGTLKIPRKPSRKAHPVGIDRTEPKNHKTVAEGGPVEIIAEPQKPAETTHYESPVLAPPVYVVQPLNQNQKAPLTSLTGYPQLEALLEKEEAKQTARANAAKFVEAASLISGLDADEADRLMTLAAEMEGPSLTSLEKDVLRFLHDQGFALEPIAVNS